MKTLKIFICVFLVFISLTGCSTTQTQSRDLNGLENMVLYELENTENIENLSDETIKTLSVIHRTNHLIKNDYDNFKYSPKSKHIKLLNKQTEGEFLKRKTGDNQTFTNNKTELSKDIKKSEILSFLKKQKIKLSNISNISPKFDENKNLTGIEIGGKFISFNDLQSEFGLESNKITNIKTSLSKITIFYTPKNVILFNEKNIEMKAQENLNYKQLLKHFFDDFDLIT